MSVYFDDLMALVWQRRELELGKVFDHTMLERVIYDVIAGLGMHVAGNGEVINPAPRDDRGAFNYPEQRNVRYTGQQRRKR